MNAFSILSFVAASVVRVIEKGYTVHSLTHGRCTGANIWPHVHISDVGDLFALVYAGALRGDIGHGKAGYYLGIAGEYTYLSAVSTIGTELQKNGWAKTSEPKTFTKEETDKYFQGSDYLGSNSRGVADRSKSIGWRPRYGDIADLMGHIRTEVPRVEKRYGKTFEGSPR